ncbi:hypothetical protein JOB18_047147 [Solea senegalensis]|uniref:Uncharacterized protein n=1 Tax=Solea senegalensis TaxID=28829 RepID=A0AAV6R7D2_SOLSE|nr:hypothetical protein JOB18_047147 [Solea senegalensis]
MAPVQSLPGEPQRSLAEDETTHRRGSDGMLEVFTVVTTRSRSVAAAVRQAKSKMERKLAGTYLPLSQLFSHRCLTRELAENGTRPERRGTAAGQINTRAPAQAVLTRQDYATNRTQSAQSSPSAGLQ